MEDSDSDVEEIAPNPNRQSIPNPIQNPSSQWNSNKVHFRHANKRGGAKNGFSNYNTDNYFEQARRAQLLTTQNNNHAINNGKVHNFHENEREDQGKGIETSDKRVNESRFHSKKPFRKSKYGFNNNINNLEGEGSSSFNGQRKLSLVRNGCISPDNINRHFSEQVVGVENSTSKGKEKIELNESLLLRKQNNFIRKRKHSNEKSKLGESSDLISSNPSVDLTIINSSSESEEEEGPGLDWSTMVRPKCNNQELRGNNAKISQVESDEMLARSLQEQFNRETGNFEEHNEEDDDAMIARVLEDSDDDDYNDDDDEMNNRDRSVDLFPQEQQFPFRGPEMQIPNHRRTQMRNFSSPDMDFETSLITQISRGWGSSRMDLDTRLNILEALEAAYENNSDMDFSDEYEILSTLDEENYQHSGASDNQINSLPVSTIKGGNSEDSCAICLETPCIGAEMRHLPCLHKFHKACIDKWLRRKNACPVCKFSIN